MNPMHRVAIFGLVVLAAGAGPAWSQQPPVHHLYRSDLPAGMVGRAQVNVRARLAGYFQPVEIRAPQGVKVAFMVDGVFHEPAAAPAKVGLLVGGAHRFRVTGIPNHEGREVYPTLEIIDRLHPPPGLKWKCPIPVELTQQELEFALEGRLVTRVIYLEPPSSALPRREGEHQRYFEVRRNLDPLHVADQLGRPMAILRMGSRILDVTQMMGGPPVILPPLEVPNQHNGEPIQNGEPRVLPPTGGAAKRNPQISQPPLRR